MKRWYPTPLQLLLAFLAVAAVSRHGWLAATLMLAALVATGIFDWWIFHRNRSEGGGDVK